LKREHHAAKRLSVPAVMICCGSVEPSAKAAGAPPAAAPASEAASASATFAPVTVTSPPRLCRYATSVQI
jgi:hypothetical protein